ncbi:hypothetical protein ACFY7C_21140 [Streptomyces sp. NPDC012769]
MIDTGVVDVFLGLDVGKGEHHAERLTEEGGSTGRHRAGAG